MSICKIESHQIKAWVDRLAAEQTVIGPIAYKDRFRYAEIDGGDELRLDFDVTLHSPKRYFLPEAERLLTFDGKGGYESADGCEPFVLFGVHPYDVVAIAQMDEIFKADNYDNHYMQRRENATIVAVDVENPSRNVFAACMGTATVQDGFDVLLTRIGDRYVVDARTEKGEALAARLQSSEEADEVTLARREQVWNDAQRFLKKYDLKCAPTDIPELLNDSEAYEHPVWDRKAEYCYSCGSCNLVCPTCYCFDVQDDVNWDLESGERRRCWDGCMLQEFALVAGEHNFRKNRSERFRHRFYRKGKYLWDRMGQIACIGCGRCITACTTNIANPVDVYNAIAEDKR